MPKNKKKTKKPVAHSTGTTRVLKVPKYKPFRLQKRLKPPLAKLPGAPRLFVRSLRHLKQHWKLYTILVLIYLVLTLFLVKGFSATSNLSTLKHNLQNLVDGSHSSLSTGLTLFGVLLGNSGSGTGDAANTYQTFLLIIMSLVFIWAIRQNFAGHKVGVRESFYKSMYPLIPFILVLLIIAVQLIPLVVGNALYSAVAGNGLAVSFLEKAIWAAAFFVLALWSVYMLCASLFAVYIVTLPDVRPFQALRSAKQLVRYRRWIIMRKLLFLPLILLIIGLVIMLPIILWLTPAAEWVFLVLIVITLPIIHSYMYTVYRELL